MRETIETFFKAVLGSCQVTIGEVPEEIAARLQGVKDRKQQMDEELKIRTKEMAKQLEGEFGERDIALEEERKAVWEEIYAHFGIEGEDKKKPYSLNKKGELSVLEDIEKSEHPIQ